MIRSVLFDADGVLQVPSDSWLPSLRALCRNEKDAGHLTDEIFAVEKTCLTGERAFADELGVVLQRWDIDVPVRQVLDIWTQIRLLAPNLALVRAVADLGLHVGLATNQQTHRAQYLVDSLGYADLFDDLFISCRMGVAKPHPDFFTAMAEHLGFPPDTLLFIDDHETNVEAAKSVGLQAGHYVTDSGRDGLAELLAGFGVDVISSR